MPIVDFYLLQRRIAFRRLVPTVLIIYFFSSVCATAGQSAKSSIFQPDFQVCSTDVTATEEGRLRIEKARYEKTISALQATAKSQGHDSKGGTLGHNELRRTQSNLLRVIATSSLGVGTYRVDISINGIMVGPAVFALK